jgi:Zn-dependent protease
MPIALTAADIRAGLIMYLILLASLCVHEWAHAWTANRLGDPTARLQGRVTLNPIPHIDLIGTVALPLIMILFPAGFLFGWAKPVPVDLSYFRRPVRDHILVTLAGPGSNVVLCLLAAVAGGIAARFVPDLGDLALTFIFINALLAVFNMIPLPPLDGSHLMRYLVGMSDETFIRLSSFSFLILIVLINLPPFQRVLGTAIGLVSLPFSVILSLLAGQAM